jgi:hypothetical protein
MSNINRLLNKNTHVCRYCSNARVSVAFVDYKFKSGIVCRLTDKRHNAAYGKRCKDWKGQ